MARLAAGKSHRRAAAAVRIGVVLLGGAIGAVGCGHPASREECEEIFRRSAEIELKSLNVTDPEEVRRRTSEAQEARGEELLQQCVGRRITDRAMRCVREAQTQEELDGCLM